MILSLDGGNRTLVTFGNYDEDYYMAVVSGKNGRFIAHVLKRSIIYSIKMIIKMNWENLLLANNERIFLLIFAFHKLDSNMK